MAESAGVGQLLRGDDAMTEEKTEIGLVPCLCDNPECGGLTVYMRFASLVPAAENPEELVATANLPLLKIPGFVAALMKHYSETIERAGI